MSPQPPGVSPQPGRPFPPLAGLATHTCVELSLTASLSLCVWPLPALPTPLPPEGASVSSVPLTGPAPDQWQGQLGGAHSGLCLGGAATNFNNSLRKKTNLSCFPLLVGEKRVCAHVRTRARDSEHRMSESRDSGVTRPHFQQSHVPTPGGQGPVFAQTSGLWRRPHLPAPEPRNVSVTCDPPWEAAEQRRESKQSRAAGEPGALELVHDPRGPQLPPPVILEDRLPRGGGQTRRDAAGAPGLCVPPSPETGPAQTS